MSHDHSSSLGEYAPPSMPSLHALSERALSQLGSPNPHARPQGYGVRRTITREPLPPDICPVLAGAGLSLPNDLADRSPSLYRR
jgi:hypothetical protein